MYWNIVRQACLARTCSTAWRTSWGLDSAAQSTGARNSRRPIYLRVWRDRALSQRLCATPRGPNTLPSHRSQSATTIARRRSPCSMRCSTSSSRRRWARSTPEPRRRRLFLRTEGEIQTRLREAEDRLAEFKKKNIRADPRRKERLFQAPADRHRHHAKAAIVDDRCTVATRGTATPAQRRNANRTHDGSQHEPRNTGRRTGRRRYGIAHRRNPDAAR